jgi:DNA-binding response OmpR family regulator
MTEILVVDDSLTVRMDLAEALTAAGFTPVTCASVAEARAALAAHPIELAILDVRLPDGDGVDLLHELRSDPRHAALPVVMLSSEAEVKDRIRGLKTGASDYVGKPYDPQFLIARIRELVTPTNGHDPPLVLIVDDSATFREALAAMLAEAGYAVLAAASGTDGLRIASARRPTGMIVDGVMPDMSGDLVIRRLRLDPALRGTPCLLLTGSDDAAAEVGALDAGADAFARKDQDLDGVLARFAAMLRTAADVRHTDAASLLGPTRVLAIDDSATYLGAVAEHLHAEGYDVATASSGEQGIELLAVQPVECILLDLVMPGMSGLETCRRIKAAPAVRDTPLVILTSQDDHDTMIQVLAAGADDFVSKQAGLDVLAARVKAQIRRKKLADEHRRVREKLLRSERDASDARIAREYAEVRAAMAEQLADTNQQLEAANRELAAANRELEAFSYSVSHDLRAPLRSIRSFTQAIEEDAGDALDDLCRDHLRRVISATGRMSDLIDALLELSRISRAELGRKRCDLGAIAAAVVDELRQRDPARAVEVAIAPDLTAAADPRLVRALFDNLLGNAWKFTALRTPARIEIGATSEPNGGRAFYVRDDGVGFDMVKAAKLFIPFQRMHGGDFPGTGIGLATVRRIVERHRGRIWAESAIGRGATFYFTLPD